MTDMLHRSRPSLLITVAAAILLFVAMATLRDAAADITAAVIVVLVMLAGGHATFIQNPRSAGHDHDLRIFARSRIDVDATRSG